MNYTLTRKFWQFIGATLYLRDASEQLVCLTKMKGWKLREQITSFRDEAMQTPLFYIQARNIIDIAATYDVTDISGQKLGAWQRKGLKSTFLRDEWLLLNAQDQQIGTLTEDSAWIGFLRRWIDFVALLVPQKYNLVINGQQVAQYKRTFNLFVVKYNIQFDPSAFNQTDYRLLWAGINLLGIMEATKQ